MSFRRYLHQLYDIYNGEVDVGWDRDWPVLLVAAICTFLTGFLLPLAWSQQHWCAASVWDHEDRWAGTKQFAITLLLCIYVPLTLNLVFFHVPLVQLPHFSHGLAWSNLLLFACYIDFWWIALLPLTPTLALILEHLDPRTRDPERVLLPWEQPASPQSLGNTQVVKPTRKKTAANGTVASPKKRKKGRSQPLGELLLEEKAALQRRAQASQRLPQVSSKDQTPPADSSASPSPEQLSQTETKRGKRESLKDLF